MVDQRFATAPATPLDRTGDLPRARAVLEVAVVLAALLVIPAILLQHYGSSPSIIAIATALDWGIWLIFATELAVVLWDRRSRHRLLLILDAFIVVVSFPLLPAGLAAFRLARLARITPALRVLRLVRLAAVLLRTGVAMRRLTRRRGLLHVEALATLRRIEARLVALEKKLERDERSDAPAALGDAD